ncbi:hypothetical protein [Sagittula sp. S175]|uniref:hypothetical protein n=1 Tax=Sagittula sp. S175 TaxID=3415129 RepID=UPI003C7CF9CC
MSAVGSSQRLIVFAVVASRRDTGSTVMRSDQLGQLLSNFGSGRYRHEIREMPGRRAGTLRQILWALGLPRDCLVILTKAASKEIRPRAAQALRHRVRAVAIDHVDQPMDRLTRVLGDFHIACSHAQLAAFRDHPVLRDGARLVLHHADLRLDALPSCQMDRFAALYLGEPDNTDIPGPMLEDITCLPVRTAQDFQTVLPRLPEFNAHVSLRRHQPGHETAIKPFVKGLTAAKLGAVIMTGQGDPDAEHFLGADYPFFVGPSSAEEVFRRMRAGFGGPDWALARDRMAAMRAATHETVIARQLEALGDEAFDLSGKG